ncbi:hypothetical protein [Rhizobium mongolense]|uniref:Uncharacterized protein n=1 Tax=Rhizobium mongolense TaxID=57676 RepID=A0A7W6WDN1_9HYPH|nr:hypothetical protein [Rhizobium mongolense]MBB4273980.1 hypothetical protein [Rhizobium mongolense]
MQQPLAATGAKRMAGFSMDFYREMSRLSLQISDLIELNGIASDLPETPPHHFRASDQDPQSSVAAGRVPKAFQLIKGSSAGPVWS